MTRVQVVCALRAHGDHTLPATSQVLSVHGTKLAPRQKRYFSDCGCPIWMYGRTDDADVPRQSTGTSDMASAEAIRASLVTDDKSEKVQGPRLADCVERYLAAREHELSEKTHGQHELLLSRLRSFCGARGVHYMRDLTVDLLEDFKTKGLPDLKSTSKSKSVEKLKCFLKDARRRDWIKEGLVDRLTPHRAVYEQKQPYTEDEITKILDGALALNGGTHGYAKHPKTFRLLLELMLETGMRVSDAVRFDPSRVEKSNHLWVYAFTPAKSVSRVKKAKHLEAFLTDRLKTAIDGCEWLSDRLPFSYGSHADPSYLGNQVYEHMQAIGPRVEVTDCRPHRLRDTFAVRMLARGVPLEDVSRLLGHSSVKVTELHYAPWVVSRVRRLESVVAAALTEPVVNAVGDTRRDGKRSVGPLPRRPSAKAKNARLVGEERRDRVARKRPQRG